ncbi:MAG: hypothetical protein ACI37Z_10545 [Candidatus Gastranaerophilaceae bacterium]
MFIITGDNLSPIELADNRKIRKQCKTYGLVRWQATEKPESIEVYDCSKSQLYTELLPRVLCSSSTWIGC